MSVAFGKLLSIALLLPACLDHAPSQTASSGSAQERPFAEDSPFNLEIPKNPRIDPESAARVAYLSRKKEAHASVYEFGIPIWDVDGVTAPAEVRCTMDPAWGRCPFARGLVPIPKGARPHTGSDGAMVVVDWKARKSYEFWQIHRDGQGWLTSWGTIQSLDGSGFSRQGSSTAVGASRLAGVVRLQELEANLILHALVMSIDNACAREFRPPAVKTDGNSTRLDCTPEGARLQLDPAIDLEGLPELTRIERTVARALQIYGVYVIDKGGAPMGISFELAKDATSSQSLGETYRALGMPWDYYGMPHIPWDRLRLLEHWDGS